MRYLFPGFIAALLMLSSPANATFRDNDMGYIYGEIVIRTFAAVPEVNGSRGEIKEFIKKTPALSDTHVADLVKKHLLLYLQNSDVKDKAKICLMPHSDRNPKCETSEDTFNLEVVYSVEKKNIDGKERLIGVMSLRPMYSIKRTWLKGGYRTEPLRGRLAIFEIPTNNSDLEKQIDDAVSRLVRSLAVRFEWYGTTGVKK